MFIKTLKLKPRPLVGGILFAMSLMANAGITLTTGADTRLSEVINSIQKQSDFKFFYDDNLAARKVKSVSINDEDINAALQKLFEGTGIVYSVKDNVVYLNNAANDAKEKQTTKKSTGAPRKISGVILDENGEPLIGASVRIKGSKFGVATDFDGNYTIETTDENPVMEVTYVGYKTKEIKAEGPTIDIAMTPDSETLDEVVVTALGIKREQKSLSYNVQQVNGESLSENKDANFINGLAGKVAGVNINASSSGVGGISKVVMRGTKSIMQSSNALYVVDGMPMRSANNGGSTEFGSQGATEPIADINPEDIESMSVLTGAAAAALYGSEAANGAIVITTKKGKAGRTSVTINSSIQWDRTLVNHKLQSRYGTGSNGAYVPTSNMSWGAPLSDYNSYNYQPTSDYFRTGMVSTQSVTFSTGTEKNQTYASAAAVNSLGITPNNRYDRYNFSIRNTSSFLADRMTLDLNASYIRQTDRNMINQGTYGNPMVGALLYPRGNSWDDVRSYEHYDAERNIYVQNWGPGDYGMTVQNPYWINYRNLNENSKDRYMLGAHLSYKILDCLTLTGRVRIDNSNNQYTQKYYATTNSTITEQSDRGFYGVTKSNDKQIFADFLLNFNKNFGDDWSLQANFGGSISDMRYDADATNGPIADGSEMFANVPAGLANFFAVQNLSTPHLTVMQTGWREQTQSLYASADVGFKNTYYLTVTGRNDWPSQLAGPNSRNSSFFYPSVGLSALLNNFFPDAAHILNLWKVRASFASVGSAFNRYIANPRYQWNSNTQSWSVLTQYPMYDLKPERTKSFELGMNFRVLNDITFDATYYHADTNNQTFNPELPVNQYSKIFIQTGSVRNWGMEFALSYKHTWGDFAWNSGLTYSFNRNKITELADNASTLSPANASRWMCSTWAASVQPASS